MKKFNTLKLELLEEHIVVLSLNRPKKMNAQSLEFYSEFILAFQEIKKMDDVRVVIVRGEGKAFSSGIDLNDFAAMNENFQGDDSARSAIKVIEGAKELQKSMLQASYCNVPVIASIHGICFGAGVDLSSDCDIRFCTEDAQFSIKETEIGLVADIGTMQKMPVSIGSSSKMAELAFTGRVFTGKEAKEIGFVSNTFPSQTELENHVMNIAKIIASMSPVAIYGIKKTFRTQKIYQIEKGLEDVLTLNGSLLASSDIATRMLAKANKTKAIFPKL